MIRKLLFVAIGALLFAFACSDDGGNPTATTPTWAVAPIPATSPQVEETSPTTTLSKFPRGVGHDAGLAEIPELPTRIAALSATHVEMLFALGVGDRVIAGDLFSNYPPDQVSGLKLVDSFNLNVEAVIDLDPDLVLLSFDPGGAVAALDAVGIPTLLFGTAADLDDVYGQIRALGRATASDAAAEALVADMRLAIDELVESVGGRTRGVTFYHESDPLSYYTANSRSFIGRLYRLLGMENISDEAPDEFSSGFPQLSPEFIVAANPGVIFLASFGETAETVAERNGWQTMSAVASGAIVLLDYDAASRWGPRVVELLEAIAAGVIRVSSGTAG